MYPPASNAVHKLPQKPVFPSWEDGRPSRDHPTHAYSRGFAPMVPVAPAPGRAVPIPSPYPPSSHSRFPEYDPHSPRLDSDLRGMREDDARRYSKANQTVRHRPTEWWPRDYQHYGNYDSRSYPDSRSEIPRDKDSTPLRYDQTTYNGSSAGYRQPSSNRSANSYYPNYQEGARQRAAPAPSYPRTLPRRSAMGDYKLQERRREAGRFNHYSPPRPTGLKRQREISSSRSRSRSRSRSGSRSRYHSRSRSYTRSRSRSRSIASSRESDAADEQPKETAQTLTRELDAFSFPSRSPSPSEDRILSPRRGSQSKATDSIPTMPTESPSEEESSAVLATIDVSTSSVVSPVKDSPTELPPVPGLDGLSIAGEKPSISEPGGDADTVTGLGLIAPLPLDLPTPFTPDKLTVADEITAPEALVTSFSGPEKGPADSSEIHLEPANNQSILKMRSTVDMVLHSQISHNLGQETLRQQSEVQCPQEQWSSELARPPSPKRTWEDAFTPLAQSPPHLSRQASPKPLLPRRLPPRHELVQPADNITEALRICIMARQDEDKGTRNDRVERILAANLAIVDEKHPRSAYNTAINVINANAKIREGLSPNNPIRQALIGCLTSKERVFERRKAELEDRYYSAHKKWLLHCQRLDTAAFRQQTDGMPTQSTRTTRRSAAALGDAVRSDLEMEQIMISLGNDDLTDPNILATRNLAKVPDMLSSAHQNPIVRFDDTSNEVFDPQKFYDITREVEDWSEDEKKIFVKAYAQYPKQFGIIAAALEHKTVEQCVLFYYVTKKESIDFRDAIARWGGGRKKRGGGRKSGKQKAGALLADIANTRLQRRQTQPVDSPAEGPPPDDDMPRPRRRPKPKAKDMELEMARAAKRAEAAAESEARRPKRSTQPLTRLLPGEVGFDKPSMAPAQMVQSLGLAIQAPQAPGNPSAEDLVSSDKVKADYLRSLGSMAQRYERLIIQQPRQVVDALQEYAAKYSSWLGLPINTICFVKSSSDPYTAGSRIIVQALSNQISVSQSAITSQTAGSARPSLSSTPQNKSNASSIPGIDNNLYKSPFPNPLVP